MENDRPQATESASPSPKAGLAERVRKIQEKAAQAGIQSSSEDSIAADKAFMDEMWGED